MIDFECWKNSPSFISAIHNIMATGMEHFYVKSSLTLYHFTKSRKAPEQYTKLRFVAFADLHGVNTPLCLISSYLHDITD